MHNLAAFSLNGGLIRLLAAFVLAAVLTPLGIRLAWRLNVVDRPSGDKIHRRATPLMGGVAIAAAFLLVSLAQPPNRALLALLLGCALAAALGVIDELRTLPPRTHLIGQVIVVVVAIAAGFPTIQRISNPFSSAASALKDPHASVYLSALLGFPQHLSASGVLLDAAPLVTAILGLLFTIFWIVGMMNTVNFLDGLDGLASGVGAIAALFLGLWALVMEHLKYVPTRDHQNVILPLILCGAILGFLLYNWAPARVFMGDSGAMFIGFALGALSIFGPVNLGTALLLLIVPIMDVAWAIVRRLLGRRSFASGDKHHIYHRMLELGLSRRAVVLFFYALILALGIVDLGTHKAAKVAAFLLIAVVVAAAAVALEVRGRRAEALAESARREPRLPTAEQ